MDWYSMAGVCWIFTRPCRILKPIKVQSDCCLPSSGNTCDVIHIMQCWSRKAHRFQFWVSGLPFLPRWYGWWNWIIGYDNYCMGILWYHLPPSEFLGLVFHPLPLWLPFGRSCTSSCHNPYGVKTCHFVIQFWTAAVLREWYISHHSGLLEACQMLRGINLKDNNR